MPAHRSIRRVILVVIDGLRPDAIERFDLAHFARLSKAGASTTDARTVTPSVTAAAMASLFTGVHPQVHGVRTDSFGFALPAGPLQPMPALLRGAGFPTSGFVAELPLLYRPIAGRIGRFIGIDEMRWAGRTGSEVLGAARATLASQRRGFLFMHWGDADRAGHAYGWMSPEYGEELRRLDGALGALASIADVPDDPSTLLIALSDHGGGGARVDDHDSDHPVDRTIPILLAGGGVVPGSLAPLASLVDVPATVLWALGVAPPAGYAGRPLKEAFLQRTGAATGAAA